MNPNKGFTGVKDVDLTILQKLSDKDLLNACQINKSVAQLCNNEDFWRNRFINKFGSVLGIERIRQLKPKDVSWKRYYLYVHSTLDNRNPFDIFNNISWIISNNPSQVHFIQPGKIYTISEAPDDLINRYRLNNLGKEIIISVPTDRYYDLTEDIIIKAEYITPEIVINEIYKFYNIPLSNEQKKEYIEEYDLFDLGITEEEFYNRSDLLGGLRFFEDVRVMSNVIILLLGS